MISLAGASAAAGIAYDRGRLRNPGRGTTY